MRYIIMGKNLEISDRTKEKTRTPSAQLGPWRVGSLAMSVWRQRVPRRAQGQVHRGHFSFQITSF